MPDLDRCLEAAGAPNLKTQSPLTLGWRLRVEIWYTCSFVTMMDLSTPADIVDSRRYRGGRLR
jgi:hypothetical protein